MPRPHPTPDCRCRLCWLYANDERYRRLWDDRPIPPAAVPLPCVHEGHTRPAPGGVPDGKTYLRCDAGRGDPPGVVCRCHCGPGCGGYEAAD
jgi:hypothetical protein